MKVICINNKIPKTPHLLKPEDWIYEGYTYTVHSSYKDEGDGLEYFYLVERLRFDHKPSYRANRFIPLSNIREAAKKLQPLRLRV